VIDLLITGVPLLFAVILHEIAHGYVALRRGDPTAQRMGRLTLNPISHIDPVGTILLPGLLYFSGAPIFGWAKPVPIDFSRLDNPRRDMIAVAAAGPAMNVALALVFAAVFHAAGGFEPGAGVGSLMALRAVQINILLAVLNLTPILPLDGGRILFGLLPRRQAVAYARTERYGLMIVMALLFTGVLGRVLVPVGNMLLRALL
jgi:Zn-dependent protease